MKHKPKIEFSFYSEETDEDIDCFIIVEHYVNVKPNPYTWESDLDYYGYVEIEYRLVDQEGNQLNVEINEELDDNIKQVILEYFEDD